MKIETASGHTILADDADYPLLRDYGWWASKCGKGRLYACAHVPGSGMANKKRIKMHRLLMNPPPGFVVHHKNNNGLDNRRENLEVATHRTNILYIHAGKPTGVHFHKQTGKWRAQLRLPDRKVVSLGLHLTKDAAIQATDRFKKETKPWHSKIHETFTPHRAVEERRWQERIKLPTSDRQRGGRKSARTSLRKSGTRVPTANTSGRIFDISR